MDKITDYDYMKRIKQNKLIFVSKYTHIRKHIVKTILRSSKVNCRFTEMLRDTGNC
jgi:hypothetical protein